MRIYIRQDFPDHPKTQKLVKILGEVSIRCFIRFLQSVADKASSGDITHLTDDAIEIMSGWQGQKGGFAEALRTCRFIVADPEKGTVIVNGWSEHQANHFRSKKAAKSRWGKNVPTDFNTGPELKLAYACASLSSSSLNSVSSLKNSLRVTPAPETTELVDYFRELSSSHRKYKPDEKLWHPAFTKMLRWAPPYEIRQILEAIFNPVNDGELGIGFWRHIALISPSRLCCGLDGGREKFERIRKQSSKFYSGSPTQAARKPSVRDLAIKSAQDKGIIK